MVKLDHYELIDRNDKIQFIYKAKQVKFEDKTLLKDYFRNDNNPVILVIDTNNLLTNIRGQKLNFLFRATSGGTQGFSVDNKTTINQLLKAYLFRIDSPFLIDDKPPRLDFLFNAAALKFDQTPVEDFFKNSFLPLITVISY